MEVPIVKIMANLDEVVSSESSKLATHLLLRNPYGGVLYAGLFGYPLPGHVVDAAAKTREMISKCKLDIDIPHYSPLGDALRALDPEETQKLETQIRDALMGKCLALPTLIDRAGRTALDTFFLTYVKPHVLDLDAWDCHDTMMLLVLLFSYNDFEPSVFGAFKDRLGAGIAPALQRYRIQQQPSPISFEGRNFDLALVLYIMHHIVE